MNCVVRAPASCEFAPQCSGNSGDSDPYSASRPRYKVSNVSFDLYTDALAGSANQFTILFDTPTVRNLVFRGTGEIEVRNIGSGASGVVGSYSDLQILSIDMLFDIAADQWDIFIDNVLVYSDSMDAAFLRSIRFSQGARFANQVDFNATTYVDNILITTPTSVSEPGTLAILAIGAMLLGSIGRTRQHGAPTGSARL